MTLKKKEILPSRDTEQSPVIPHYCDHLYCRHIATTSVWGWRGKELVLKGQWCWTHDRWWKRIELPKVPKNVRNHLLTILFLAGTVTLAIKSLPIFLITLVATALGILLYGIYVVLWEIFDSL